MWKKEASWGEGAGNEGWNKRRSIRQKISKVMRGHILEAIVKNFSLTLRETRNQPLKDCWQKNDVV